MIRRPISRNLLAMIGTTIVFLLLGCGETTNSTGLDAAETAETAAAKIEEEWGVKVLGIRRTAAGYMLDFRYRVVDAEKAAPILDRRITPYVQVQETGVRLLVPQAPKLGSMRQTSFAVKADRDYFIVFANPSQIVSKGDLVSVVVGDFVTPALAVQ
jgi:hypothetical protein